MTATCSGISISAVRFKPGRSAPPTTSPIFGEDATIDLNETVGRGPVYGLRGGYRFRPNFAVALGVWGTRGKSESAIVASIPDPLVTGHFKTVTVNGSGMNQTDVGVDLQLVWMRPIGDRLLVSVFGGPSFIHVAQDVATVAIDAGQNAVPTFERQSKNTAKAGNVGVDALYSFKPRYGIGVFVRFAGGTVDLPSVPGLTVGGVQVGGRLQMWF